MVVQGPTLRNSTGLPPRGSTPPFYARAAVPSPSPPVRSLGPVVLALPLHPSGLVLAPSVPARDFGSASLLPSSVPGSIAVTLSSR